MFGVAPVRTRGDYMEAAPAGLPPRPNAETGAESALLRTRSLLDIVKKQQKCVLSNYRLSADVRADELAALALLRSLLEDLESSIAENENPPPTISKRKALIKVEKARRSVLAAVRDCSGHVAESQKLFEDIERFIELRPEEPVSPRQFNIKWTRNPKPLPRPVTRRRDQVHGRNPRPQDSLVMSIVGLSAIAEGRERDTPTADTSKLPTSVLAPGPTDKLMLPVAAPTAAAAVPGGCEQPAIRGAMSAAQTVHDAALLLQQMQLQPRRTTDSVDAEDDLRRSQSQDVRPSMSHDVAPSAATTLCNMDSCVSGPLPRGAVASGAGCEVTDSNLRSYGAYEDGDEDEDEVNSAEGRCYDAGSPEHRVALLGGARTAASAAGAVTGPSATRSTASTPPHPNLAGVVPTGSTIATAAAVEAVKRSQESLTSIRPLGGVPELRRRVSSTNVPLTSATSLPSPAVSEVALLAEGGRADAAAAELDAIDAMTAAAAAQQPAPPPASRYGVSRHHSAAATALTQYNLAAAAGPSADGPYQQPPLGCADGGGPAVAALQTQNPQHPAHAAALAAAAAHPYGANGYPHPRLPSHTHGATADVHATYGGTVAPALGPHSVPPSVPSSLRDFPLGAPPARAGGSGSGALPGAAAGAAAAQGPRYGGSSQPPSGHHSLDSGQFPASATAWDNVSLADTEPLPGGNQGRRGGRRKGPGGLLGLVRNVVGFVGVSVLSGAAMALGAAAVNTGLDEQQAAQQARQRQNAPRRGQRLGRGGDDLIPQRTLQQLRSPDLLALGRG